MKKLTTCMMLMTTLGLSTLTSLAYADDSQNFATAVSGDWTMCLNNEDGSSALTIAKLYKISDNQVELTLSDNVLYDQPNCTGDVKDSSPSLLVEFQNKATLTLTQPETKAAYTVAKMRLNVAGMDDSEKGVMLLHKSNDLLSIQTKDLLSVVRIKDGRLEAEPFVFQRKK